MICSQCGNYVSDDLRFCPQCGARQVPQTYAPQAQPTAATAAPADKWRRHFMKSWRRFATSTPALILLVCVTLTQILGLFGVADSGLLGAAIGSLGGVEKELGDLFASVSFIGMIPGILTAVAMWMLYLDARTPGPRLNVTGMTILKVLQIVTLVGTCIAFGISLLLMLGLSGGASKSGLGGLSDLLGVGAWLMAVVAAIVIAYNVLVLKTISAIKTTMETCDPDSSFAMILGVFQIISGAVSLISSFAGDFSFGTLLRVACSVLYGWLLIQYKNLMEKLSGQRRRAHGTARPY